MRLVMKFGGTSVDGLKGVSRVAEISSEFISRGDEVVLVISAMAGVTDSLIRLVEEASRGNKEFVSESLEWLREKHLNAVKAISREELRAEASRLIGEGLEELKNVLMGVSVLKEATPRTRDYVLSFGERLSTPIVAYKLIDLGFKARYLTGWDAGIVTDENFGRARPIMDLTEERVRRVVEPLLESGVTPVITGFIAATIDGKITTLGRGGSDYTASIIGACIDADEVWIWTDVDGVMTADPKVVSEAKTVPRLSYDEAAEMAHFGAKVLHPPMIKPVKKKSIPIRVKNTFNPRSEGTLITSQAENRGKVVKAVGLNNKVCILTVREVESMDLNYLLRNIVGWAGEVILASQSFPAGSISVIIPAERMSEVKEVLERQGFRAEWEDDVSLIAVIGSGMRGVPGIAAKVFKAVAERGINIRMIVQGPSELNITLVVKRNDGEEAVKAIHEEFKLGG